MIALGLLLLAAAVIVALVGVFEQERTARMAAEQGAPAAATAYPPDPGTPPADQQAGAFRRDLRR